MENELPQREGMCLPEEGMSQLWEMLRLCGKAQEYGQPTFLPVS